MKSYVYFYRPVPLPDFMYIFPKAVVDWTRVRPVAVYRSRVPQRNFMSYGKVEVAGIEMVIDMKEPSLVSGVVSRTSLRHIFDVIERPPAHV